MTENNILKVDEIFTSIQGEGIHTGRPMNFVRLFGCNLACIYCDTPASDDGSDLSIDAIVSEINNISFLPVYITGGEPLKQSATLNLIVRLIADGREVHLDTNGTCDLKPVAPNAHKVVDIKTPGSGAGDSFLESNLKYISKTDEIKFIITSRSDFDWSIETIDKLWLLNITPNVLIQPAWGMVEYKELVEWLKECEHPVRLSAQLHKFIWGPDVRGV